MRSPSSSKLAEPYLALPLLLSVALSITSCVHRQVGQILPQATLGDTRTKSNLAVGQIFIETKSGDLATGPNLQSFGLVQKSLVLSPLGVSQSDITLGELLSAMGTSSANCEASLKSETGTTLGGDWFEKEQQVLVGKDVSFLLQGVSEEIADPRSLDRLLNEVSRTNATSLDSQSNIDLPHRQKIVIVRALYARHATLRFRVPDEATSQLTLSSERFLGHRASTVHEIIIALVKMASVCGAQGHARELPDPGEEFEADYSAPMNEGVAAASVHGNKLNPLSPLQTDLMLYRSTRLPSYTHESRVPTKERVWTVNTDSALHYLKGTNGQAGLDDGARFFKYCSQKDCKDNTANDAIIAGPREFDRSGRARNEQLFCTALPGPAWQKLFLLPTIRKWTHRDADLRELVLFFGSPLPDDDETESYDYTSRTVQKLQPSNLTPDPKSGPTKAVWIYEYHCEGGIAQLLKHPSGTTNSVSDHLKGMGLE